MKIRIKLTLIFGILVGAILLLFSFSIFYFYSLFREIEFYGRLKDKAQETVELLTEIKTIDANILKIIDRHDLTTLYGEQVMMYDLDLNLLYKSGKEYVKFPVSFLLDIKIKKEIRLHNGGRETIGIKLQDLGKEFIIIVSAIDKYGYQKIDNLLLILSIGWFTGVLLVFIIGFYYSESALKPIADVVEQVDKITISQLNLRVNEGNGKDEIAQLAKTFNSMLVRLEEAFLMQKTFVSNASHELRTPMTAITGEIEVTLMQKRPVEEYEKVLSSILDETKNLTQMTNGLLELARLNANENAFSQEQLRIDELIWASRSDLSKKNPNYYVKVEFQNFPDDEQPLFIRGNANLLKTAFLNLMENACKFSNTKSAELLVVLFFNKVQIVIMDNGIGIPKADIQYVFQPFYRSIKSRSVVGYGIGLSLVDRIIRLHKGIIEVNSTENVGTIFTITLFKEDYFKKLM
ncbi:MAG: sensor histidine kinase [Cytophagales bacterium]